MDADVASLRIVISSTSCMFTVSILGTSIPSTTTNGFVERLIEDDPRITNPAVLPSAITSLLPLDKPGTNPSRRSRMFALVDLFFITLRLGFANEPALRSLESC
ncbi:hypothetical protein D3C78_995620 [compost metagenome]